MKLAHACTLSAALVLAARIPVVQAADEPARFQLRTLSGLMKYDQESLRVKPGQAVVIEMVNEDQLPHNLVVLKESGIFMEVAQRAWELGERGPVQQWIPDDPRVLAFTPMIDPGMTGSVSFTAPEVEGDVDFVCTFPGHAMIMNGTLTVSAAPPPGLRDLTCMIFRGEWDRLPDFLALSPEHKVAVDEVNDNLISLGVTDLRDHFGLVFNGLLDVPIDGDYTFFLGSDDGSRLLIDDDVVINNDGIHAHTERRKRVSLTAGVRRVRVEYFEQAGDQSLTLAWSGPGFRRAWLSKEERPGGEEIQEIVLTPVAGRAVVYRGFLAPHGGSRRLIAVGTPDQVHFAFDQDQLRLALMWKGAFLDVGRHWTGRGAGEVAPLGFAVVARPPGEDMAVLSDGQAWPTPDDTGRARHSKFLGYQLDAAGLPTFRYRVGDVWVEESMRPSGRLSDATDMLLRTIDLQADGGADGLHFRLAEGDRMEAAADGGWRLGGTLTARIEGGGAPIVRDGRLVVPIEFGPDSRARLVVTYRWL